MYKLREVESSDIAIINTWRNDPELIEHLGAPFRYINTDVDKKWYEQYLMNRNNAIRCAIVSDDSEDIIGLVSLVNLDFINRSGTFNIMIGCKKDQNQGAGTFAVYNMLYHAFYNMNLNRVDLAVLADNKRAIHLYEKMGFRKEGEKKEARYKCGKYVDLLEYAILKCEFENMLKKNKFEKMGGGVKYELPTYCINKINSLSEISYALKCCKYSFYSKINEDEIIDKLCAASEFLIAYNQQLLGLCATYANNIVSREGYISIICVRKEFQNMHIGRALLGRALLISYLKGMKLVRLEVNKNNSRAISFYKKNKFTFTDSNCSENFYMKHEICFD